tara:strand:- start:2307 stop:3020 length:714 start_codon:yes stop_codon:yes gene_type:complete
MAKRSNYLPKRTKQKIDDAVAVYQEAIPKIETAAIGIVEQLKVADDLGPCIHFIKHRVKDPSHLTEKLVRKTLAARTDGKDYEVDAKSLFSQITDLIGIRILHLHTSQLPRMHLSLLQFFEDQRLTLVETPFAVCWDSENREFYKSIGLDVRDDSSMYTSVHYVFELNQAAAYRCELQVRTVMDEVWGEVSHKVNYPSESPSSSCKDQLKVLARLTSGCVRLVDSIFESDRQARDTS